MYQMNIFSTRIANVYVAALVVMAMGAPAFGASGTTGDTFPRLGGIQIGGWASGHDVQRLDRIARLDIAIINLFVGHNIDGYSIADITSYLKKQNPNLKLLQYVNTNEVHPTRAMWEPITSKMAAEKGPNGIGDWFARNAAGENVGHWKNTWMLNITDYVTPDANGQIAPQWVADWFSEQYFEVGGRWDGFFMDIMRIEPFVTLDWDRDGKNDYRKDPRVVDKYTQGNMAFYNHLKKRYPDFIGIGNITNWPVAENPVPARYRDVDGGILEALAGKSFSQETWGGFAAMMAAYRFGLDAVAEYIFFSALGSATDYKFMRYTLAGCLMDNGYYAHSPDGYFDQYWFDEFDVNLGYAIDPPQYEPWRQGIYMRRFDNGIVFVNPDGNGSQTFDVPSGYRKIKGTQDPNHNDGKVATAITLHERDGIILVNESGSGDNDTRKKPQPPILH
jgi:hypothetical protein